MRKSFAFPTLDNLVDLACGDGVDIRPTLLRVLTDLYVQKPAHSTEEEVQYVELALGLIEAADAPTRAAVASRLAAYPAAPLAVLSKLEGARPVAETKPQTEPVSEPDLVELFFDASAEERRLILTTLDAVDVPLGRRGTIADDVIARLENAALQHNVGEFAHTLERALGVSQALADRIARDPSGEPIVVAAKALGMRAAVLQRILLFLNPQVGQSVKQVYDLARLYDDITSLAAESMLAIWRQTGGQRKPQHEPLHWDDGQRSARSHATHGAHRVARRPDLVPSRSRLSER
jgi:hypothetical protein